MKNSNVVSIKSVFYERMYKEFYNAKAIQSANFSFFKSDVVYLKKARPFRVYKSVKCCG